MTPSANDGSAQDEPVSVPQQSPDTDASQNDDANTNRTMDAELETQGRVGSSSSSSASSAPKQLGRYELLGEIGRGGFGAVYLGRDPALDREVAIKVPNGLRSQEEIETFFSEARRLAKLQHRGIVSVHDVGEQDGTCYIVTELLDGESLADRMRKKRPSWQTAVSMVAQVAEALGHAHSQGIVHRDIKPGNIFITKDDVPILIDFGLAVSDIEVEGPEKSIAGTPSYMSPEQVKGKTHNIDGRTDIYSLGVVLYELLTGRTPFKAKDVHVLLRKVAEGKPQPIRQLAPSIPSEVERVCSCAMAKRPIERFVTGQDFADALRKTIPGNDVDLPPVLGETVAGLDSADMAAIEEVVQQQASVPTSERLRGAERRQISLLLINFELLSEDETFDAESHHDVSQVIQQATMDVIDPLGGSLTPSAGQETLVCFGYPTAYEDAARRAVMAAVRICRTEDEWRKQLSEPVNRALKVWAVVHTGEAVAEELALDESVEFSSRTISLSGNIKNVVSRLETQIEPEGVTITSLTHQLVAGYFEFDAGESYRLRGIPQPVETFIVTAESRAQSRVDLVDPIDLTPLVGRNTELSILEDRWEQTLESMGQVVLLIGDAGLGKSRLIRELRESVKNGEDDAFIVEWRCSPYHASTGLYPAIEFLRQLLANRRETSDDPSDPKRWLALTEYLEEIELDGDENRLLMARLLSITVPEGHESVEWSPQRQRELTDELLLEWLEAVSRQQSLLFVVEDLHWIDPSSLELLQKHVTRFEQSRILSLLTFRPEFQTPWSSLPHQTQIALNRLTKRQIKQMLSQKFDGAVPEHVALQIAERTDGIPLFVEEFSKVLAESSQSFSEESQDSIKQEIPATLQDLLVARLNRMDCLPEVIQIAATLGREFDYDLLAAVADTNQDILATELEKLVQAEVLFCRGSLPDCVYIFKHALIQDAAYQSMLSKTRKLHHLKIASTLADSFPAVAEEQSDVIARHFAHGGDAERAIEFWVRAGKRAQAMNQNNEAITHYQNALEQVAKLDESTGRLGLELSIQVPLGVSMLAAKGYANPDCGPVFDRALELCEQVGDAATRFYILWGIWAWRLVRSDLNECKQLAVRLLDEADSQEDTSWKCEASFVPQVSYFYNADFKTSRKHGEVASSLFQPERCQEHLAGTGQDVRTSVLPFYGLSLWYLGEVDDGLSRARQAIEVGHRTGHAFSLCFAFHHSVWLFLHARLWQEAQLHNDEAYRVSREQGFALWIASSLFHKGLCNVKLGHKSAGLKEMREGLNQFLGTGAKVVIPAYQTMIAEVLIDRSKHDEAREFLDAAVQWAKDHYGQNHHLAETHRVYGDLALSMEDSAAAEAAYEQSIVVADQQQALSWKLRTTIRLAELFAQTGRKGDARTRLKEVLARFNQGLETPDLQTAKELIDSLADK